MDIILSKNNNFVNVRFHSGATAEDIVDFNKPVIKKKLHAVLRPSLRTNNLTNGTST